MNGYEAAWRAEILRRWTELEIAEAIDQHDLELWDMELADVATWDQLAPLYGKEHR